MKRSLPDNIRSDPFPSLPALQEEHLRLAAEADEIEGESIPTEAAAPDAPRLRRKRVVELRWRVGRFENRAARTGILLDEPADRELAQSILDYWCVRQAYLARESARAREIADPDRERARQRVAPRMEPLTLAPFDAESAPELADDKCPFIGLGAFDNAQRSHFHGRSAAVGDLIGLVGERRLVIITGPLGSGKSSLVMAGLVPALRAGAAPGSSEWVYWPAVVPGEDPFGALLQAVRPADRDAGQWLAEARPQLEAAPKKLPELVAAAAGKAAPSLLVVDEAGELFDMAPESAWAGFLASIVALAQHPDPAHRVIVTIREDYLERLFGIEPMLAHPHLGWLYRIPAMTSTELRMAIEEPAKAVGLKFDHAIVDDLVREVINEPAALPLLQFTLLQLWKRRERNRISYAAYEEVGRPADALARAAERVYRDLAADGDRAAAREAFLALVTPTVGSGVLRRRLRRDELQRRGDPAAIDRALDRFAEAGLIRRTAGESAGEDRFEVMHEALVRTWSELGTWLEETRRKRERLLMVLNQARLWDQSGRRPDHVVAGDALAEAAGFEQDDPLIRDYVAASRDEEARRRGRGRKVNAAWVGVAGIAAAAAVGVTMLIPGESGDSLFNELVMTTDRGHGNVDGSEATYRGPGRTGYLLVGTEDEPLLADASTGTIVQPRDILVGRKFYRLRLDGPLHQAPPAAEPATPADPIAEAQQGSLIVAGRGATTVERNGTTQYWRVVRVVPRVVIRFPPGSREKVEALGQRLRGLGYDVPRPVEVPTSSVKPSVRYYHAQDRVAAAALARTTGRLLRQSQPVRNDEISNAGAAVEPGTLELWLDLS